MQWLGDCLGHEHPIEWITVMKGKGAERPNMLSPDRKLVQSGFVEGRDQTVKVDRDVPSLP